MRLEGINSDLLLYINRHLRTAGWHAAQMRTGVRIETKDAADDFVTAADRELDVIISSALSQRLPDCADLTENSALADGLITEETTGQLPQPAALAISSRKRVWYLDPVDGTDNYVKQDGCYCIMLGLVIDNQPVYGWVYAPARDELYFGGPPSEVAQSLGCAGLWSCKAGGAPNAVAVPARGDLRTAAEYLRITMGSRDRRQHPQIANRLNPVKWVSVGSLGLKVMAIVNDEADVYIHCSEKLKFWDTAGPAALARALGLKVCGADGVPLPFTPRANATTEAIFTHKGIVLIGTEYGVMEVRGRIEKG